MAGGHSASYWVIIERWAYSQPCQRSKTERFRKIIVAFNYFRKTLHLKSLRGFWICRFFNMSGFWIFQDCQYARVLNFQGCTGFTYFSKCDKVLNMREDAIMEGFWVFQKSEYARFLHMQALHKVLGTSEHCWILP